MGCVPFRSPVTPAPLIASGVEAVLDPRRAGFGVILRSQRLKFALPIRVILVDGAQFFLVCVRALIQFAILPRIGDDLVEVQEAGVFILVRLLTDGVQDFLHVGTRNGQFVFTPVRHGIAPWVGS